MANHHDPHGSEPREPTPSSSEAALPQETPAKREVSDSMVDLGAMAEEESAPPSLPMLPSDPQSSTDLGSWADALKRPKLASSSEEADLGTPPPGLTFDAVSDQDLISSLGAEEAAKVLREIHEMGLVPPDPSLQPPPPQPASSLAQESTPKASPAMPVEPTPPQSFSAVVDDQDSLSSLRAEEAAKLLREVQEMGWIPPAPVTPPTSTPPATEEADLATAPPVWNPSDVSDQDLISSLGAEEASKILREIHEMGLPPDPSLELPAPASLPDEPAIAASLTQPVATVNPADVPSTPAADLGSGAGSAAAYPPMESYSELPEGILTSSTNPFVEMLEAQPVDVVLPPVAPASPSSGDSAVPLDDADFLAVTGPAESQVFTSSSIPEAIPLSSTNLGNLLDTPDTPTFTSPEPPATTSASSQENLESIESKWFSELVEKKLDVAEQALLERQSESSTQPEPFGSAMGTASTVDLLGESPSSAGSSSVVDAKELADHLTLSSSSMDMPHLGSTASPGSGGSASSALDDLMEYESGNAPTAAVTGASEINLLNPEDVSPVSDSSSIGFADGEIELSSDQPLGDAPDFLSTAGSAASKSAASKSETGDEEIDLLADEDQMRGTSAWDADLATAAPPTTPNAPVATAAGTLVNDFAAMPTGSQFPEVVQPDFGGEADLLSTDILRFQGQLDSGAGGLPPLSAESEPAQLPSTGGTAANLKDDVSGGVDFNRPGFVGTHGDMLLPDGRVVDPNEADPDILRAQRDQSSTIDLGSDPNPPNFGLSELAYGAPIAPEAQQRMASGMPAAASPATPADSVSGAVNFDMPEGVPISSPSFVLQNAGIAPPAGTGSSSRHLGVGQPLPGTVYPDPTPTAGRYPMPMMEPGSFAPRTMIAPVSPVASDGGKKGGLVLGGVLGLVLGLGAAAGVWLAGLLDGDHYSEGITPTSGPVQLTPLVPLVNNAPSLTQTPKPKLADADKLLNAGDPVAALDVLDKLDAKAVEVKTAKGIARWQIYLQKQAKAGAPLAFEDDVKAVLQELVDAEQSWKTANKPIDQAAMVAKAMLARGLIYERFGQWNDARTIYTNGAQLFAGMPQEKLFYSALTTLEVRNGIEDEPTANPDLPNNESTCLPFESLRQQVALTLLTTLLQDGGSVEPLEPAEKFYEALAAARKNDFAAAIRLIDEAKARHAVLKELQPGKNLSPTIDGNNTAFERACDELKKFWTLQAELYKQPGYAQLAKKMGQQKALQQLLAMPKDDESVKLALEKLKGENLGDKKLHEGIAALIDQREMAKKMLLDTEADLLKVLKDAGVEKPKVLDGIMQLTEDKKLAEKSLADIAKALKDAGIDQPKTAEAIAQLVADRKKAMEALDQLNQGLAKALIDVGAKESDAVKAILALAKEKKDAEEKYKELLKGSPNEAMTKVQKEAEAAKAEVSKLQTELKKVGELVKDLEGKVADATKSVDEAKLAQAKAEAASKEEKQRAEKLAKDLLAAQEKAKKDLEAAKKLEEDLRAQLKDAAGKQGPVSLNLWLAVLADPSRTQEIVFATKDAEAILNDEQATPEDKAKAKAVLALAKRNEGKFAEAATALKELQNPEMGFDAEKPWAKAILLAEKELLDGSRFVLSAKTLEDVDALMKKFEGEAFAAVQAKLLAKRAELKLDADADAATQDAQEAVKVEAAGVSAKLVLARLAERKGDYSEALKLYRELQQTPGIAESEFAEAIKTGLARSLLLKMSAPAKKEKEADSGANAAPQNGRTQSRLPAASGCWVVDHLLTSSLALTYFADEEAELNALIDELIKDGNYRGHLLKADYLARKGNRVEALAEMKKALLLMKDVSKEDQKLVEKLFMELNKIQPPERNDPPVVEKKDPPVVEKKDPPMVEKKDPPIVEKIEPDTSLPAGTFYENPAAELRYGVGLYRFHSDRFADAEIEFLAAIRVNPQDARYWYYLGLSRYLQGKLDQAEADFQTGAKLERRGLPATRQINASLERVQGPLRRTLNSYRP